MFRLKSICFRLSCHLYTYTHFYEVRSGHQNYETGSATLNSKGKIILKCCSGAQPVVTTFGHSAHCCSRHIFSQLSRTSHKKGLVGILFCPGQFQSLILCSDTPPPPSSHPRSSCSTLLTGRSGRSSGRSTLQTPSL